MTKWGVGPTLAFYSAIYCIMMYGLTLLFDPFFRITLTHKKILVWMGLAFIFILGIPFLISSAVPVMRAFKDGRLVTTGVYSMCRHPIYAAWLIFFFPGIALIANSLALLSTSFVMYFVAGMLVKKEDVYLEKTFGQAYLAYKKRVPAILPYGWLKKN